MKCSNHYERDVVSQCVECGKGLCPECTNKYNVPLCDHCALVRINANKNLLVKNSILMIGLFILGFFANESTSFIEKIIFAYFVAGIPWGWSILTNITPSMFLFLPWIGWLIYFAVKLIIAMFIGMFVTPYKIYKIIKGLSDSKDLENYAKGTSTM